MTLRGCAFALGLTVAVGCAKVPARPAAAPPPVPAAVRAVPAAMLGADTARHGYTGADVRFMQQMIHHHAQAVQMAALVPSRSSREDIHTLAQRIDAAQQTEIEAMRHWLEERHELAPGPSMPRAMHDMHQMHDMAADSGMDAMLMPGMLTPAQMRALAAATGTAFDRLFLEGMIHHHEGALKMVADLLATPGAGEEPQLFGFASDVDAGQRAEIRRMQAILAMLPDSASPR